jgi:peptide/nickel transport system substrate-binding protein
MRLRQLILALCFVAGSMIAQSAFAQKSQDLLRFGLGGALDVIDPYYTGDREVTMVVGEMVFDTLVYRDPTTFEHKPLLATAWRWPDELTLELDLRDGVQWQDGVPFSADDVVYTYNFITNPANKIWRIQWANWIKSTEVVDPHKVRLHLTAPFGPALEYLAQLLPILPKDFYGTGGKAGGNGRLVGTGPYRITSFQQGKEARFEKNATYFRGGPKGTPTIGRMMFRNIPDPATQVAELVGGGLDWIWRVPSDQLADLSVRPGLAVATGGTMRTFWVGFDARKPPFNDARVRRAVGYAIDRKALATELMGAGTKVLDVPCYPTQFGCIDAGKVPHFDFDSAKAKSLMAEAGLAGGVNTTMVIYAQGQNRDIAEAIQGYLRPVGIRADLNVTTIKGFFDAVPQEGKAPLKLESYGQYNINDVSILLPGYYDGGTQDTVRDVEITEWLKQAAATSDAPKRKQLYEQVDSKIIDQAYWIPLFIQNVNYGFSKDFDFHPWPDEDPRFYLSKWK